MFFLDDTQKLHTDAIIQMVSNVLGFDWTSYLLPIVPWILRLLHVFQLPIFKAGFLLDGCGQLVDDLDAKWSGHLINNP